MTIIGICGKIGSGKNTVAEQLRILHNFSVYSLADPIKDVVSLLFKWDRDMLEGRDKLSRRWREELDLVWTHRLGRDVSPRLMLQEIGSECFRDCVSKNFWIEMLVDRIKDCNNNIVIPDVRFDNERDFINNSGGYLWGVTSNRSPADINTLSHQSETCWQSGFKDKCCFIIYNNHTIEDLQVQVEKGLKLTSYEAGGI